MPAVSDFAELLEQLKHRSGRSYAALAARAGLSSSTLHRWCRGERVPPDFRAVESYARVCGAGRDQIAELHRRWLRADIAYREFNDRLGADRTGTRPVVPAQLPGDVPGFVGRVRELRRLQASLKPGSGAAGPVAVLAIAGTAGVGKPNLENWHTFNVTH